jgi:CheY-like chemotaxis protein
MVHGLVQQLGGALDIQSRRNMGTNVLLWLPTTEAGVGRLEDASAAPQPHGRAGTALLVDDEELVRISTADMLGDLGFVVVEASSAEEALKLIEGGVRPDVLITDHLMPGMTGTHLARTIREARPDLPVLIVSGYAASDGIAPDLPRLTKPFRNEELAAKLAQITA